MANCFETGIQKIFMSIAIINSNLLNKVYKYIEAWKNFSARLGVIWAQAISNTWISSSISSTMSLFFLSQDFNQENAVSIGLKSGEYGGKNSTRPPSSSIMLIHRSS